MGQIVGYLGEKGEPEHLPPVPQPVPGVEEPLHHQKAKDGEGNSPQDIAELPPDHQLPQGGGGILVHHQPPVHPVGIHQRPDQKAADVVDDHTGHRHPFQPKAAKQTVSHRESPSFRRCSQGQHSTFRHTVLHP